MRVKLTKMGIDAGKQGKSKTIFGDAKKYRPDPLFLNVRKDGQKTWNVQHKRYWKEAGGEGGKP